MAGSLTSAQSAALFDILSHYNTYAEIRDFRDTESLDAYGPPLNSIQQRVPSTSPSLQRLVWKFVVGAPGIKDVPEDFWSTHVRGIIGDLQLANLSESYDKGSVGTRKTLATAASALIEYPVRGTSGGFPKSKSTSDQYDLTSAEDLTRAFDSFLDGIVYENLAEELVTKIAATENLSDHDPVVQALHEYLLVNIASFLHYTIILSPSGQYMITLMANVHKLTPYAIIKQTLKIGNVATMVNAMMKVLLAKMSVASVTNWVGMTKTQDTGMNLLQTILSQVLNWDVKGFQKRATKIEKDSDAPTKAQLQSLKEYADRPEKEQTKIRNESKKASVSIVVSILEASALSPHFPETTHKLALEYLACHLSIRDRKEIIRVMCHGTPDHLTTAVRTVMEAYEPVIRGMHNSVDLAEAMGDQQAFLGDFIKLAKIPPPGKDGSQVVPTVADFVQLLKLHEKSFHKFLHQMCKNGGDLITQYVDLVKQVASEFRQDADVSPDGAGKLESSLQDMFKNLSAEQQKAIIPALDAHNKYLEDLRNASISRLDGILKAPPSNNPVLQKILASASKGAAATPAKPEKVDDSLLDAVAELSLDKTDRGPGAYLDRWEDLLEKSPLTTLTRNGKVKNKSGKVDIPAPNVSAVIEAMAEDFRKLLGTKGMTW